MTFLGDGALIQDQVGLASVVACVMLPGRGQAYDQAAVFMSVGAQSERRFAENRKIIIDGSALEKYSGSEDKVARWSKQIEAALYKIYSIEIGQKALDLLKSDVRISPYMITGANQDLTNAYSRPPKFNFTQWGLGEYQVRFSADSFLAIVQDPGAAADEILFHELLHVLENNAGNYRDPRDQSFQFDGTDFVTITGTNVYISSQEKSDRKLRHDHRWFKVLPESNTKNHPAYYAMKFWENFKLAKGNNSVLYGLFCDASASWNPYSWSRISTPTTYRVSVKSTNWMWKYLLFPDVPFIGGRSYWEDYNNPSSQGFGKWTQNGSDIVVTWDEHGSWDRIPLPRGASKLTGRTKAAGVEYDTEITVQPIF